MNEIVMSRLRRWQERVMAVLNELDVEVPSEDADLLEGGGLDSVTFAEMLVRFEDRFGVVFHLDAIDVNHFRSVRRMAELLAAPLPALGKGEPT